MACRDTNIYRCFTGLCTRLLADVSSLLLRLLLARVFLLSGLQKWDGWFNFSDQTTNLFLYEFFCPDPIREGALLLCNPETLEYEDGSLTTSIIHWFAVTAGVFEVVFPILLILGLFTRVGALGLLGMTLFIQLAVYPEWGHWWNPAAWWAVVALAIAARGPGRISLDHLFAIDRQRDD